jgi:hypothetical protein
MRWSDIVKRDTKPRTEETKQVQTADHTTLESLSRSSALSYYCIHTRAYMFHLETDPIYLKLAEAHYVPKRDQRTICVSTEFLTKTVIK